MKPAACALLATLLLASPLLAAMVEGPYIHCRKPATSKVMTCRLMRVGLVDHRPWWTIGVGNSELKIQAWILDLEYNRDISSVSVEYLVNGTPYSQTVQLPGD